MGIPLLTPLRYRYALPLLVTLVSLCLFLASTRHQTRVPGQEWSPIFKAEMVLNLPAVFVATPIVGITFRESSDASVIGLAALLAPFLWYWIGRWVDRQLGTVKMKIVRARSQVVRTILRVLAYGFLALCVLNFTPLNPTPSPESSFLFATLAIWLLGYLVCSYWNSRVRNPVV